MSYYFNARNVYLDESNTMLEMGEKKILFRRLIWSSWFKVKNSVGKVLCTKSDRGLWCKGWKQVKKKANNAILESFKVSCCLKERKKSFFFVEDKTM